MVKALEPRPKFLQFVERIAARPALQALVSALTGLEIEIRRLERQSKVRLALLDECGLER